MTRDAHEIQTVQRPLAGRGTRRRHRQPETSDSSNDVILVDSLSPTTTARSRRRRRVQNDDIVDLTCSTPNNVTEVPFVDLTSPSQLVRHNNRTGTSTITNNNHPETSTEEQQAAVLRLKCPVCLEHLDKLLERGSEIRSTNCGHVFCKPCIFTSIRATHKCPTCRKKLTERTTHPLYLPIS
uniref:E3 ubiquitin-protein ligase RNF4 n=1 Tax=Phallusia mammillata TaxID=59560 RepID=A0A6F9DQD7_9ASCI|nr:E3 ubiquitin-protein ligase RNF4 [Phallusia mammillata]